MSSESFESFANNGRVIDYTQSELPPVQLFASSTPIRDHPFVFGLPENDLSSFTAESEGDFSLFAAVRRPRRINYTDEDSFSAVRPDLPVRWKDRKLLCVKYVDDCLSVEKVSFSNAEKINANGKINALARASKTESHLQTVEYNSAQRGMQINKTKTNMMCISAAKTYEPQSYVMALDGTKKETGEKMKILGFHFNSEPNVRYHMKLLHRRFKCRLWSLRHLKKMDSLNQSCLLYTSDAADE